MPIRYNLEQLMNFRRQFILNFDPSRNVLDKRKEYYFDDSEFYMKGNAQQLSLEFGSKNEP